MNHGQLSPGSSQLARLALCATLLFGLALLPGSEADRSRLRDAAAGSILSVNPGTAIAEARDPEQARSRGFQISLLLFRFR